MFFLAVALWMQTQAGQPPMQQGTQGGMQPDTSVLTNSAMGGDDAMSGAGTGDSTGGAMGGGDSATVDSSLIKEIPITVTVPSQPVTVGDHFLVTVRAHVPADMVSQLRFPSSPDSTQPVLTGVEPEKRQDVLQGGYVDVTETYTLAAWMPGKVGVALGAVLVGNKAIPIPARVVVVRSVLPKDSTARAKATPKNLRDLLTEPALLRILRHPAEHKTAFGAILLAVLALVGGGVWLWVRSRREEGVAPTGDWVESEFQRIEAMRLIEKGEAEQHAILMATVLRQYLIRTFPSVRASATTREVAAALRQESLIPADRVLGLYERVDLLKFAHAGIQGNEAQGVGTECRAIVNEILDRHQAAVIALEAQRQAEAGKKAPGGRQRAA